MINLNNFNFEKCINIFINTAPQVLIQLLCPWQISLHWSIATIGVVLYILFLFWLLSVLKIRKGALLVEHVLILMTILAAILELGLAKLMDDPLLVTQHRKELNSRINRFKKKCPFATMKFYLFIESKLATGFSVIKNWKSNIVKLPNLSYKKFIMIFNNLLEQIKKLKVYITKLLENLRSKF